MALVDRFSSTDRDEETGEERASPSCRPRAVHPNPSADTKQSLQYAHDHHSSSHHQLHLHNDNNLSPLFTSSHSLTSTSSSASSSSSGFSKPFAACILLCVYASIMLLGLLSQRAIDKTRPKSPLLLDTNYAYATSVQDDSQIPSLILLAHSLKSKSPGKALIVMTTADVDEKYHTLLQALPNVRHHKVDVIMADHLQSSIIHSRSFGALWSYKLSKYKKVLYLDVESLVQDKLDDIFELPGLSVLSKSSFSTICAPNSPSSLTGKALKEFSTMKDPNPTPFHWNVLLIEPHIDTFERLLTKLERAKPFHGNSCQCDAVNDILYELYTEECDHLHHPQLEDSTNIQLTAHPDGGDIHSHTNSDGSKMKGVVMRGSSKRREMCWHSIQANYSVAPGSCTCGKEDVWDQYRILHVRCGRVMSPPWEFLVSEPIDLIQKVEQLSVHQHDLMHKPHSHHSHGAQQDEQEEVEVEDQGDDGHHHEHIIAHSSPHSMLKFVYSSNLVNDDSMKSVDLYLQQQEEKAIAQLMQHEEEKLGQLELQRYKNSETKMGILANWFGNDDHKQAASCCISQYVSLHKRWIQRYFEAIRHFKVKH